ncbi:U4/U6-U5 snRNP complex subunit SNU66 PWA37_001418 [Arxiozyma heterogenica]|uniref:Uncharacterized protein n=1 Tax=Arxiozyma heterogenica TaxID=278026 RepID=A0AAN8A8Y0_9SACH|nr:hypothetical protein RI543_002739 [Kazachstania heterogenica]
MSEEISLSIEETNKLRIQLGLKPIPYDPPTKNGKNIERQSQSNIDKEISYVENKDSSHNKDISFITEDKVFLLRSKLSKINQRINGNKTKHDLLNKSSKESEKDWLNQVGKRHLNQNKVKLQHYSEEEDDGYEKEKNNDTNKVFDNRNDELPIMKVSHDINALPKEGNTILTLKDTDIINDSYSSNEDILENEDLIIQEETEKNLKLKTMNKDRRRHKMSLKLSSVDIHNLEYDMDSKFIKDSIIVGGIIQSDENKELTASQKQQQQKLIQNGDGKIRVIFESDNEGDEEITDFKRVKIKKRKKKGVEQSLIKKRKKIELPPTMNLVHLNDESDEKEDDDDELNNLRTIIPQRKSKVADNMNEHEIVMKIKREQLERQERLKSVNRLGNIHKQSLTIDESSAFFDLLNTNIVSTNPLIENQTTNSQTLEKTSNNDKNIIHQSPTKDDVRDIPTNNDTDSKVKVDFYNGIAATLHFLKDQDVLPKRKVETSTTSNNILSSTNQFNDNIQAGDNRDLSHYNPEIKLEYKDAYGNLLTTKEAYKKLSQKFHGTKSNKKKQMKFNQKIIERNQHTQLK